MMFLRKKTPLKYFYLKESHLFRKSIISIKESKSKFNRKNSFLIPIIKYIFCFFANKIVYFLFIVTSEN